MSITYGMNPKVGLMLRGCCLLALSFVAPMLLEATNTDSVEFQHVQDADTVAQVDAILPMASWTVQPGTAPPSPTQAQVKQMLLLASNDPVVDDIEICNYRFLNVTGDSSYELLLSADASGRHFCDFTEVIRRVANGYDVQSFDGYHAGNLTSAMTDLDNNGIPEIRLTQTYSDYEGARGCQAGWTSIFRWDGTQYVNADFSYPAVYQQRLDTLNASIDKDNVGALASSPDFELQMSCDYMERDRIQRFLGIDPRAGLDRALSWASSASEQLRDRAVTVLSDINDPAASKQLQALAQDNSPVVAQAAQAALASPSFFLNLNRSLATTGPGSSTTITVTETVNGGFVDPVSFSIAGLPTGVTATFAPSTLASAGITTLTFTASSTAVAGSYQLAIIGVDTANSSLARSIGITLTIQPPGGFSLSVSSPNVSAVQGASVSLTISEVTTGPFVDPVSISITGLPNGVSASFAPAALPSAGTSTLTLNASASATIGSYALTITGTDTTNSSLTQSAAVTLTIAPATIAPACQVTYVNSNDWGTGFSGSISIANNGSTAINGWTLGWTWSGDQQITQSWGSSYVQNGSSITLTDAGWDGTIAPGASVAGIGFNANYDGMNTAPTAFYVNGVPCNAPAGATSSPAAPTNLTATTVSSSQINLSWTPSTTSGVTYNVYASTSPGVTASPSLRMATGVSSPNFQHQGLTASTTYYYVVTAVNAGGESTISNQASATSGGASCQVSYVNQNDWGTGFTGSISLTNTDNAAIQSWTLTWTWPGNQQITGAWNASSVQNGANVTLSSLSSDSSIAPGATISGIGFNANYTGTNSAPVMFYLNGVLCQQ